jgi:membrane protease YdiL (CAAX protease family)
MTLLDHGLVFIIAIVYPIAGFVGFRRLLHRVAAGESINRSQLYRNTIIGHWTLLLMCMAMWAGAERPWSELGFGLQLGLMFAFGVALTILGIVVLFMQLRQVKNATQEEINGIKKRFGKLSIILPQNGNELARFYGLSITAGIVEEILWRGFLIWYLGQFMPLWVAALLSVIGFGLAHAYQGAANLPQVTAVGAAFTGLYLLTGSIWLPVILHAAVDILQGRLAYDVIYRSMTGEGSSTPGDAPGSIGMDVSESSHR